MSLPHVESLPLAARVPVIFLDGIATFLVTVSVTVVTGRHFGHNQCWLLVYFVVPIPFVLIVLIALANVVIVIAAAATTTLSILMPVDPWRQRRRGRRHR